MATYPELENRGGGGSWGPDSYSGTTSYADAPSIFKAVANIPSISDLANTVLASAKNTTTNNVTSAPSPINQDQFVYEDTGPAEDTRSEAERIIDEAYNAGMSALDQFESTLQPAFEETKSGLLTSKEVKTGQARDKETLDLGQLAQNEATEKGRVESAIASARREAGEMMQGLASRFGGSTGTGMFGGEVLGRQALANISGNRQAFQEVRGKIIQAGNQIKLATQQYIQDLDLETQNLINQAQQQLRASLADIASRRGMLAQDRANQQLENLYRYQDTISGIQQRNNDLKNQITMKAQSYAQRLSSMLSSSPLTYEGSYDPTLGQWSYDVSGGNQGNLTDFQKLTGQLAGGNPPPSGTVVQPNTTVNTEDIQSQIWNPPLE